MVTNSGNNIQAEAFVGATIDDVDYNAQSISITILPGHIDNEHKGLLVNNGPGDVDSTYGDLLANAFGIVQ